MSRSLTLSTKISMRSPSPGVSRSGRAARAREGFALVITLSLMVLLALIAVGLLSLSTVSLRGSSRLQAQSEARANARLALTLAIGQLQKLTGQDTRVTAGSDLIDKSNVRATGVWRSWEGTDRDNTGKPVPPNYSLKSRPGDPANPLGTSSEGRFLGWLASPLAHVSPDIESLAGLSSAATSTTVPLVASGSVDDPNEQIHATPTEVGGGDGKGKVAWWVSGDNAKAMLNVDPTESPTTTVGWHTRIKSNGRADAHEFGYGKIDDLPITTAIPSTATLKLVDPSKDVRRFHDLTAFSSGLLTNTATGG